jgi:hypothetical protein
MLVNGLRTWNDIEPSLCPQCGKKSSLYAVDWDSGYCKDCNLWLNGGCSVDPNDPRAEDKCPFRCWERPKTPFEDKK